MTTEWPSHCQRCGVRLVSSTMSKFNLDVICLPCQEDERGAPGFAAADAAECDAVRKRINNFPGVGLSVADSAYLDARRRGREN